MKREGVSPALSLETFLEPTCQGFAAASSSIRLFNLGGGAGKGDPRGGSDFV